MKPRILIYDVEITPILGWTYGMFEHNVVHVERESYIMCFSYQWYGDNKIHHFQQPDFERYSTDPFNDREVALALRDKLDEANIVVGHNSNGFDNKVAYSRFIKHGFSPPSPFKTVDTYKAAKKHARFASNSLANLSLSLELGSKPGATHGKLWHDCVDGDMKAWRKMRKYNNQDVELTRRLYDELRPYITSHPNMALLNGEPGGCPRCGGLNLQSRGYAYTTTGTFNRFWCTDCGAWSRGRLSEKVVRPELVSEV